MTRQARGWPRKLDGPWPWWFCALVCVLASYWLWPTRLFFLGLHGDEAYVGLRAHALAQGGAISTLGMNSHTGPLHQWLVALAFALLGPSVQTLRAIGAVANGVAIALYGRAASTLLGPFRALWCTLVLASMPAIRTFAGVATEHMALGGLLSVSAWLLVQPKGEGQILRHRAFAAGIVLGLGTWNHLVFLAVPAAFLALAIFRHKEAVLRQSMLRFAALGWALVELGPAVRLSSRIKVRHGGAGILTRLTHMPELMVDTWTGKFAAMRTVGFVEDVHAPVYFGLLGLAFWGVLAGLKTAHPDRQVVKGCLCALAALLCTTAVIVPFDSDRFVWLALWLWPMLLVAGLTHHGRAGVLPRRGRSFAVVGHLLCACAVLVQLHSFTKNIARPLRDGRLEATGFAVYGSLETANHHADIRPLFHQLQILGARRVVCQNFIGWPLRFEQLCASQKSDVRDVEPCTIALNDDTEHFEERAWPGPSDCLVQYRDGPRSGILQGPNSDQIIRTLDHFIVSCPTLVPAT